MRPDSAPPPLKMFPETHISEPARGLHPLETLELPIFPSFLGLPGNHLSESDDVILLLAIYVREF